MFVALFEENLNIRDSVMVSDVLLSVYAIAIQTVPTGLSGVPPDGPAIPVVAMLKSVFIVSLTPFAIASAHSLLTAPYLISISLSTFKMVSFIVLE